MDRPLSLSTYSITHMNSMKPPQAVNAFCDIFPFKLNEIFVSYNGTNLMLMRYNNDALQRGSRYVLYFYKALNFQHHLILIETLMTATVDGGASIVPPSLLPLLQHFTLAQNVRPMDAQFLMKQLTCTFAFLI